MRGEFPPQKTQLWQGRVPPAQGTQPAGAAGGQGTGPPAPGCRSASSGLTGPTPSPFFKLVLRFDLQTTVREEPRGLTAHAPTPRPGLTPRPRGSAPPSAVAFTGGLECSGPLREATCHAHPLLPPQREGTAPDNRRSHQRAAPCRGREPHLVLARGYHGAPQRAGAPFPQGEPQGCPPRRGHGPPVSRARLPAPLWAPWPWSEPPCPSQPQGLGAGPRQPRGRTAGPEAGPR